MKNLFKDHHTSITLASVIAVLNVLMAITCYYMQYDSSAISWATLLGAFFTLLLSVVVVIYNKGFDSGKALVGIEIGIFALLTFVAGIFEVVSDITHIAQPDFYFSLCALPLASILVLANIDRLVLGKSIITKPFYIIPVAVLAIVPTVLIFIFNQIQAMFYVYFIAMALIFICGIIFAVTAIIKKKSVFFSWSYLFYVLAAAASFILRLLSYFTSVKTHSLLTDVVILLATTFMLVACIAKEEN